MPTADDLGRYAAVAEANGFTTICANDHLVFSVPWLDSLVALAAVVPATRRVRLMTSIALPVPRGPLPLAKALWTLQLLSEGRLVAGLGPGSHLGDYDAAGIPFDERWPRFEASVRAIRRLLGKDAPPPAGFYQFGDLKLSPSTTEVPIWIGSWGSDAGLRRVARLGDGWLASIYNIEPATFEDARQRLAATLAAMGREPAMLPTALGTAFCYLTGSRPRAEHALETIARMLGRAPDTLRNRLLIGSPEDVRERLEAFRRAGAERVFIWPVTDETEQLEMFARLVAHHG